MLCVFDEVPSSIHIYTCLQFGADLVVLAGRLHLDAAGGGHELELEGELALDVGRGAVLVGRAARLRVLAPPRHEHGTPLVGKPCSIIHRILE